MVSWSDRLRALDHASVRLADKTAALNQLLRDLQHDQHTVAAHAAAAAAPGPSSLNAPPRPLSLRGSPQHSYRSVDQRSQPHTPLQAFRSPLSHPVPASPAANAAAQIARLQQWLAQLDHSLSNAAAPPSFAALDALARMHALALSHPLPAIAVPSQAAVSASPQPALAASPKFSPPTKSPIVQPRHVITPAIGSAPAASSQPSPVAASPVAMSVPPQQLPSAASPAPLPLHPSPIAVSAAASSSPSPSAPASTRSALITIKPLQSAGQPGVTQPGMHGVAIPPGTAFVNGRWIRTSPPPQQDDVAYEQSEDEDPFADFSDHDASAPSSPRNNHNQSASVEQSPPSHSASGRRPGKLSSGSGTLRRRAEGDVEIGEEDVLELDERAADGRLAAGAGARRASLVTLSPSVVLADGQWQARAAVDGDSADGDAIEEEEDDVFADIPDLDVDAEEEAKRRAAELARAHAAAAAAQASRRAAALSRKTTTLRKDLSKHMGQDAEIDDADLPMFDESDAEERQSQAPAAEAEAEAEAVANGDADADSDAIDADFEEDVSQALESPRASRLFAPDLRAPKSAPNVTALTTRREGQAEEEEQWADVSLLPSHLRHASHSASAVDDRPDDLDDLDEEDEEPLPLAASPQTRQRHAHGLSSDLSAPATPSSAWRRGGAFSDDDLSELDASRGGMPSGSASGFASRSGSRMSLHSHSHSLASHHSHSHSNHGQLSAALSDDDADQLDDMLDEDEERQVDVKIDVNNKANKDRAARQRQTHTQTNTRMRS